MGSLSARYARGGGPRPNRSAQRRGPLRKIIGHVTFSGNVFESEIVKLECGHTARSWGGVRARCAECPPAAPLAAEGKEKE